MESAESDFEHQVRELVDEHRDEIPDVRLCRLLGGVENDLAAGTYEPSIDN